MFVNLVILSVIVGGAIIGYRHGLILVAGQLLILLVALAAAFLLYHPVSTWIVANGWTIPTVADVTAAMGIVLFLQILSLPLLRFFVAYFPEGTLGNRLNAAGGGILNGLKTTVFVTLGLIVGLALPLSAEQKTALSSPAIPKYLLAQSGAWQQQISGLLGRRITDTVNFLTVKPESEESVPLGFTTTNVREDPASEAEMLALLNKERAKQGLRELVPDEKLREAARLHAKDMLARGYFAHITPEGKDPFERLAELEFSYLAAGENLALAPTLNMAHNGLMNSPGHRANMLSRDFGRAGIGVIDAGRYGKMWVQEFAN